MPSKFFHSICKLARLPRSRAAIRTRSGSARCSPCRNSLRRTASRWTTSASGSSTRRSQYGRSTAATGSASTTTNSMSMATRSRSGILTLRQRFHPRPHRAAIGVRGRRRRGQARLGALLRSALLGEVHPHRPDFAHHRRALAACAHPRREVTALPPRRRRLSPEPHRSGLPLCRNPRGGASRDDRPAARLRRGAQGAAGGLAGDEGGVTRLPDRLREANSA